ncbi:hypothetical protein HWV62_8367 [Athelia sp. TMB]|nr:hypothetical protein HWV62_8367 [Athelia sp. TMB]
MLPHTFLLPDIKAVNTSLLGFPVSLSEGFATSLSIHGWDSSDGSLKLATQSLRIILRLDPAGHASTTSSLASTLAASFVHEEIIAEGLQNNDNAIPDQSLPQMQTKPDGIRDQIPLFASVIRRVFAGIAVDATNSEITIINPGHASFTLSISEWHLASEEGRRNLTLSGIHLSTNQLRNVHDASLGVEASETIISSHEPVTLCLIIPPPAFHPFRTTPTDNLRLVVSMGLMGCAIRSEHINSILGLLRRWTFCRNQMSRPDVNPNLTPGFDIRLDIEKIVILFLPPFAQDTGLQWTSLLPLFFENPVSDTRLPRRHVRACLDNISFLRTPSAPAKQPHSLVDFDLTLKNMSIDSMPARQPAPSSGRNKASPPTTIIRIDRSLPFQYSPLHASLSEPPKAQSDAPKLPTFKTCKTADEAEAASVMDLLTRSDDSPSLPSGKARRRKRWKKAGVNGSSSPPVSGPGQIMLLPRHSHAISLRAKFTKTRTGHSLLSPVELTISPMVVFLDLESVLSENIVLEFLEEMLRKRTAHASTSVSRKPRQWRLTINLAFVRIEVRCPPSSSQSRSSLSQSLIVDLHNVELRTGTGPRSRTVQSDSIILSALCERVVGACPLPSEEEIIEGRMACMFLSLGSVTSDWGRGIRFNLEILSPNSSDTNPVVGAERIVMLGLDIPSTHAEISQPVLDTLQAWLRDISKIMKDTFGTHRATAERDLDARVLWNRVFNRNRSNGLPEDRPPTEFMIRASLSEAFARMKIPGVNDQAEQPMDAFASNVDILVQPNPKGRAETIVTLGIVDASVTDHEHKLAYSTHRHAAGMVKSTVQFCFAPLAKQSPADDPNLEDEVD